MIRVRRLWLVFIAIFLASFAWATPPAGYQLSWNEEFAGEGLDESRWLYRADEKQRSIQLPENVEVTGGELILNLTPLDTPINGFSAAGAGVITRERFHYGYYETRGQLGDGINDDNDGLTDEGWHHAFWAMAAEANPDGTVSTTFPPSRRTEIDGFENGSTNLMRLSQHVLPWNAAGNIITKLPSSDISMLPEGTIHDYHTYGFEWTPSEVKFFIDNVYQHSAHFPADIYEHDEINLWLTAISTNYEDPDQELSRAKYDYFRFYSSGDIDVASGNELLVGTDRKMAGPVGGTIVDGSFGPSGHSRLSVGGNVTAQSGSLVHGTGIIHGNVVVENGGTLRVGTNGLASADASHGVTTSEGFELVSPGDAFLAGGSTGLLADWTFHDLGNSTTDASFAVTGADGSPSQPTDPALTGESQMLFQRSTNIDFANENSGGQPFVGAVAVTDSFDTSGNIDVIEADFVFDGHGDSSGRFLDTKLVFGYQDIDNWLALSLVAGQSDGVSTQVDVTANIDGNRENVFGRSGSGTFNGAFPEDRLLRARVVHDSDTGFVQFRVTDLSTGDTLVESYVVDDRFKVEGGQIGFGVNNDSTGYDNFLVSTYEGLLALGVQTMNIDGNFELQAGGLLDLDIADSESYDRLEVDGDVTLAGTLDLSETTTSLDGIGQVFELLLWDGALSGGFEGVSFPSLEDGMALQLTYQSGAIIATSVLGGDFDNNGIVDAADFTIWRDRLGEVVLAGSSGDLNGDGTIGMEEYDVWRANFGRTANFAVVPEPQTTSLLIVGLLCCVRRFSRHVR